MTENWCSRSAAESDACELPAPTIQRTPRTPNVCPVCGQIGKSVQGQTVKAFLLVSLRQVRNGEYLFCRTQTCPVVYFSWDSQQTFTAERVRKRVYQKEPNTEDVCICYCFRHTVGDLCAASHETRVAIIDDINAGIQADQCACDLRNPQGSCCLGNARGLVKQLEQSTVSTR